MKSLISDHARNQFVTSLEYLVSVGALQEAHRLDAQLSRHISRLCQFPNFGRRLPARDAWQSYIPGTKIVLWYRVQSNTLIVIAIWSYDQNL